MTRERYESLPLATLKELAKARNMKGVSTLKKSALIDEMLKLDETEKQMQANEKAKEEVRQEMKEKKEKTPAIGIENCRKRLELLYPGRFNLTTVQENRQYKIRLTIRLQ